MMARRYEVSDGLFEINRQLADFEGCGVTLDGEAVRALRRQLKELAVRAQAQAHELSRLNWNAAARAERLQAEQVMAEAARADGNVILFPTVQPAFSDGRPS